MLAPKRDKHSPMREHKNIPGEQKHFWIILEDFSIIPRTDLYYQSFMEQQHGQE